MRVGTVASGLGVVAGAGATATSFLLNSEAFRPLCAVDYCSAIPWWYSALLGAVGLVTVVGSLAGLFGPKRSYYIEAGAAGAVSIILLGVWGQTAGLYLWSILGLAVAAAAMSLVAARSKSGFTEQSNPMNLPVFG